MIFYKVFLPVKMFLQLVQLVFVHSSFLLLLRLLRHQLPTHLKSRKQVLKSLNQPYTDCVTIIRGKANIFNLTRMQKIFKLTFKAKNMHKPGELWVENVPLIDQPTHWFCLLLNTGVQPKAVVVVVSET